MTEPMEWLNYHHLRYFWSVAREGSMRVAAEKLGVSQPSISAQIHLLEESLGAELFRKKGRSLILTDTGRVVYNYAEEIFALGRDLLGAVRHGPVSRLAPFHVGLTDTLPKLAAAEILRPVFKLSQPVRAVCHEDDIEDLLPLLATHRLDIILADEPAPSSAKFKTFNHSLGTCGVTLCAPPKVAARLRQEFPKSLDRAPALLPAEHSPLRRILDPWFDEHQVRPEVIAEFDDPALMQVFALDTPGFFPLHAVAVEEAVKRYGFRAIATLEGVRSEFFAITAERKLKHPATVAVTQNAQERLLG
ncbi:LysR family transcriptional regulator [Roseimicrobium gellanilyticum]|nr:LysR family transcriptional regulator [Roseimicrobium gellanilyticum]